MVATTLTRYARSFSCRNPASMPIPLAAASIDVTERLAAFFLQPVEFILVGHLEAAQLEDLDADPLEDGFLASDPAPHRRESGATLPQRRPRHAPTAGIITFAATASSLSSTSFSASKVLASIASRTE